MPRLHEDGGCFCDAASSLRHAGCLRGRLGVGHSARQGRRDLKWQQILAMFGEEVSTNWYTW